VKALSLWQPWASLVAIGAKQYDTRSWSTTYRGDLAIHAALLDRYIYHYDNPALDPRMREALIEGGFKSAHQIPVGAVLCLVRLVDCYPVEQVRDQLCEREIAFGDYSDGRFAWKLEMAHVFRPPVPARGHQGLWNWSLIEEAA
jgi:hypothetical protein